MVVDFKQDILNKPNALRKMSDDDFNSYVTDFATSLSTVDYHYEYSVKELLDDWVQLLNYNSDTDYTSSQRRAGMKLCEQFFPNFFDIYDAKGRTFSNYWTPDKLEKVLIWNRHSHETPYLSEFRRGIYFCYGLTKSTMFRPHLAKTICDYYKPTVVLDPCCGWGGRMLGTVASGSKYIGFEPNTITFKHLNELVSFLNIGNKVELHNDVAENIPQYSIKSDLILTSPPYFNTEIYSKEETQCMNNYSTYEQWRDGWLSQVVEYALSTLNYGGVSCWNVSTKMQKDIDDIHTKCGFEFNHKFGILSSARQTNQNEQKNKRTSDVTLCYNQIGYECTDTGSDTKDIYKIDLW